MRLFFQVVFPLLRSVIVTVIVVQSVAVFNDFQNPLYFLPGDANATVQLTLYNFQQPVQRPSGTCCSWTSCSSPSRH